MSNPFSDWAIQPYPLQGPLKVRLSAAPGAHSKIVLEYFNGSDWILFRETTGWIFDKNQDIDVGVMACSPGNSSFHVEFWDIKAQDYSELAYAKGEQQSPGSLNPNLNPQHLLGS